MVYRNYETDPLYGDTAKCVYCIETGPTTNEVAPIHVGFDNGGL